ncbi:MAG: radical SAM protein [Pelagibacteraceae bacterium]|nr:radical SAM protein [Pelagibacteraceae bacterium]MCI5078825.1 radical SAM protein [Pelagibacteraceae bacterium]
MSSKVVNIGSTQINNGFSGQYYLPYSVGILQSFIKHNAKDPSKYNFQNPIYKRELLHECVDKLKDQDVVLLSTYVWNINISLAIGKELRKINPDIYLIYGGPSVPDNVSGNAEEFLRSNDFIDVIVHQEGERTILNLLEIYPSKNFDEVPNISWIDKHGKYRNNKNLPRMRDFENVPSPYLTGVFDGLIKENPNERWLASWETNRGCPFSCAFCDWGSATASKVTRMHLDRIYQELDWFSKNKVEFIFCCDANFGILPRDYDIAKRAAENKEKYGYPKVLSVQNTKNARERAYKVQKLLAETGLSKGVTLAMQSVNPHTLEAIKRDNVSIEDYAALQRMFAKDNIPTYTEFILALPGDSYDDFAGGVSDVIASGQHNRIQFNNLSILPNAEMNSADYKEKYKIKTVGAPIVNVHGSLDETPADGVKEEQLLVVETSTLPREDWIKMRSYASMAEFLYFNKILQIPMLICHHLEKKSFRSMFEYFMGVNDKKILSKISKIFYDHSIKITEGKSEFIYREGWLDIYWPPGEYAYIEISKSNELKQFYDEANSVLNDFVKNEFKPIINDAITLNQNLMRQPFIDKDIEIKLNYDILNIYKKLVRGEKNIDFSPKSNTVCINRSDIKVDNWEKWMQEVIWYGHRSGAYLYKCESDIDNQKVELATKDLAESLNLSN